MPAQLLKKLLSESSVSNYVSLSNEELMKLVQSNDSLAFNEIYSRFKTPLYSYFCGLTSTSIADEMLQETFLKVINRKETFRFESPFKHWIWIIAKNTLRDYWRTPEHRFKNFHEELNGEDGEERFYNHQDSIEEQLLAKVTKEKLSLCLEKLPAGQKEIVFFHLHSELTNQEIADITGNSLGSVKSVLFRSKEKLTECFKREGHV